MFRLQNPMTASRERSTAVLGDQRANFVAVFLKLGRIRDLMLHNQISRHVELPTVAAYLSLRLILWAEKRPVRQSTCRHSPQHAGYGDHVLTKFGFMIFSQLPPFPLLVV